MPTTLNLHLIYSSDVEVLPPLKLEGQTIRDWFASRTDHKLILIPQKHVYDKPSVGVDHAWLHDALSAFLPIPTSRPSSDIGLIFARSWRGPSGGAPDTNLYGLMFDFDSPSPTTEFGQFFSHGIPRQGAAVFCDAHDSPSESIAYTAVHELGHVFNLGHDESPPPYSVMFENGFDGRGMHSMHRAMLRRAADKKTGFYRRHMPGGDNYSGTTGPPTLRAGVQRQCRRGSFKLIASLADVAFLPGEPIVLDLELTTNRKRPIQIESTLDPGYSDLRIWIQTPIGERRLYRPFIQMCRRATLNAKLGPDDSIRNNPRIHLGSNGFCLDRPGPYKVWVEYTLRDRDRVYLVKSKPVAFQIVDPRTEKQSVLCAGLMQPQIAKLLVHKAGKLTPSTRKKVDQLINDHPRHPCIYHLRYAMAWRAARDRRWREARQWAARLKMREPSLSAGVDRLRELMIKSSK